MTRQAENRLTEIAGRIREMREIVGYSAAKMAELTELSEAAYRDYEAGREDLPFTFLHKCALAFGVDISDLLSGETGARLSGYTVSRRGDGAVTASEPGITIRNMAAAFRNRLATPYYCVYDYAGDLADAEPHLTTHDGQEFDLVLEGTLKVWIGDHVEVLEAGDSIFYKSSVPHGMAALSKSGCRFLAMIMAADEKEQRPGLSQRASMPESVPAEKPHAFRTSDLLIGEFVKPVEDEEGRLLEMRYENADRYNFAFDTVDRIAETYPNKLAMIHVADDMTERRFTFAEIREASSRTANYFTSLGIRRGDRVMLVLKRHYQFWFSMLALHKIGAIAIPATNQLVRHDFEYRFRSAGVSAIVCTADGNVAHEVELAEEALGLRLTKIVVNGDRDGWHSFDREYSLFRSSFRRTADSPAGDDCMVMFFTSGTTGYPKIAMHSYKYALGHFVTAKYWHLLEPDGLHLTISETGWGKVLWGKLYGQWECEGAVFVYDFDRFDAAKILPMFAKYNITTFCAPPTMYRMLIKQDISMYDLSSIRHATTAGEALNPEVFIQFKKATGLEIAEGFGQTEMTLGIGNLKGGRIKPGSMGLPVPGYGIDLVDADGNTVPDGENGEIVIRADENGERRPGLFLGYYRDPEKTASVWHDGLFHTGDVAWRDEDGYYWYVGRTDDVIKSSGYRIGPFEIENVIMELPYVLECGVSAAPDEVRGQVVKASVVLVPGTEPSDDLAKAIQSYVKAHTAPYKYPRIVVFRDELPKTISGKIMRNKL